MHAAFRRGARIASAATALAIMPITIVAPSAFAAELLSASSSVDDTTSDAPSEEPTPQPEPPAEEPGEEVPPGEETPTPEPGEQPTPPAEEAPAEVIEAVEPQVPAASSEAAAPAAEPKAVGAPNPPANTNGLRGQRVQVRFLPRISSHAVLLASAPAHTKIIGIDDGACSADAAQQLVTCRYAGWVSKRTITLEVDADAPLGVPFAPGRVWFENTSGGDLGGADYSITAVPDAPVVASTVWDAGALDYVVTGTGEPEAAFNVTASDGTVLADGVFGADGRFTFHLSTAPGTAPSIVQSVNDAVSAATAIQPDLPDVVITDPVDQGTTNDASISGTGYPGATVTITDGGGATVGTTTVEADGKWTVLAPALTVGRQEFTATMNLGALTSAPATVSFDFAPTAPSAPVVLTPGAGEVGGSDVVFSGTGTAGQTVVVRDADGTSVCEATVESNGSWTCDAVTGLESGVHNYTATQQDKWGQEGAATAIVVSVAPDAVVVDVPAGPVDPSTPITGTGGTPGATIEVRDEAGNVVGTGTVGDDGTWSVTPDVPLPAGESKLSVVQLVDGVESAPVGLSITVESEEVGGPAPIVVTPAPGQAAAGESRVDSSKLANTGAAVMPLVAVAITGLSAGLAFLAAAARRRRRSA